MDVRMDLAQIRVSEVHSEQIIVLREKAGRRMLQIVIGLPEVMAIERRVKGAPAERPMTHELLSSTITALGGELEKVIVHDLQKHTFHAKLVIRQQGELKEVDSRPSDAIALAAAGDVPIYVADHVLREASGFPET